MDLLILLEQTTPYERLDDPIAASGGGSPGGVEGLGSVAMIERDTTSFVVDSLVNSSFSVGTRRFPF